ncbi:MAG TPA: DUF5596 domain-containing protein [Methanosarcina sp.]|nr:DUF5596 domain-containing protein [Methanosarcina sp.]
MNEQEFLIFFMEKIGFPEEAQEFFQGLHRQILKETEYNRRMDYIIKVFMDNQSEKAFEQADLLAKDMNIHSYTMSMMLLLLSCKPLSELYYERNISEDIFWDTLADLTYKLNECRHIYGIWGTFVRTWFPPFYQRNFMDNFSYIKGYNRKEFTDSWRIFGKDAGKPPVDLPRDTSLQKAFAEYLEKGGTPGVGYGILFSTCSK